MEIDKYPHIISGPITHLDEFRASEKEWREVYEASSKSPFLSFEFVDLWYGCFASPEEIRIYRAVENGKTIGFLPLRLQRKHRLRYLTSITNDHCLHSEPLIIDKQTEAFQHSIMASLFADSRFWDVLCHSFSYSFSDSPGLIPDNLFRVYKALFRRNIQPTYIVRLDKSFERYFSEDLSTNARKNYIKYLKKLNQSGSVGFKCYRNYEAITHWGAFLTIENSGWKGRAQSSIRMLQSNYQLYYSNLLELLARKDALYFYFLELDSRPIAGNFGYVDGTTFHCVKMGYDEKYREFSPANILLLQIIEHLASDHPSIRRLHMFPWDYGYKHRFMNEESSCIETILYNSNIRSKMSYGLSQMKNRIRETHPEILTFARSISRYFMGKRNNG